MSVPDPVGASEHRTTTVERGPFCSAQCVCGWRGPARRARSLARSEAREHERGAAPGTPDTAQDTP